MHSECWIVICAQKSHPRTRVFLHCECKALNTVPGTEQALHHWNNSTCYACSKVIMGHREAVHQEKVKPSLYHRLPLILSCHLELSCHWVWSWVLTVQPHWSPGAGSAHTHSMRASLQVSSTGIKAGHPKTLVEEVASPLVYKAFSQGNECKGVTLCLKEQRMGLHQYFHSLSFSLAQLMWFSFQTSNSKVPSVWKSSSSIFLKYLNIKGLTLY